VKNGKPRRFAYVGDYAFLARLFRYPKFGTDS
jgi:hypothetical protein